MPPALSDNESSGSEDVPSRGKGKQPVAKPAPRDDEDEDDDDSEVAEDEYVVEAIRGHRFYKVGNMRQGVLQLDVKWEGYDDPKDRTWETEDNMEGAIDVLNEYFAKIGGRPEPKGQKRKGRPSLSAAKSGSETPSTSTKRAKQEKAPKVDKAPKVEKASWSPPPGSWEHDVSYVDTVEEMRDPKTGKLGKFAYLVWNEGQKTQHPLKHVYQKCPQKMLHYYESHLVFTDTSNMAPNGDHDTDAFGKTED
ncbi:Chromo domain-containing protein 2 [Curvularia clavata]|uniref:Chromo domain-containing protein 2 n=1 Tax=Curvularia clavata TaxID=95742 RepID=A0A9Q8ZBA4_CURCL|nr:Chromo domain-containing protein 2 [Curvularia clavata]